MDILTIVKPALLALVVATVLLGFGMLLPVRAERVRRAVMPLALAAGFVAGYGLMVNGAWFGEDGWKKVLFAAVAAGILSAVAQTTPRWLGMVIMAMQAALVTAIMVRTGWEDWPNYWAGLCGALLVFPASLMPAERDVRCRFVGPVVLWMCATAASLVVMIGVDQRLGRMLVMCAVLAGLAGVAACLRPLHAIAGTGSAFLACMFGVILTLAVFYNPGLPLVGLILIGLGPVGAAVAWIPALRRRSWLCTAAACAVTSAILAPGVISALYNAAPTMD